MRLFHKYLKVPRCHCKTRKTKSPEPTMLQNMFWRHHGEVLQSAVPFQFILFWTLAASLTQTLRRWRQQGQWRLRALEGTLGSGQQWQGSEWERRRRHSPAQWCKSSFPWWLGRRVVVERAPRVQRLCPRCSFLQKSSFLSYNSYIMLFLKFKIWWHTLWLTLQTAANRLLAKPSIQTGNRGKQLAWLWLTKV